MFDFALLSGFKINTWKTNTIYPQGEDGWHEIQQLAQGPAPANSASAHLARLVVQQGTNLGNVAFSLANILVDGDLQLILLGL